MRPTAGTNPTPQATAEWFATHPPPPRSPLQDRREEISPPPVFAAKNADRDSPDRACPRVSFLKIATTPVPAGLRPGRRCFLRVASRPDNVPSDRPNRRCPWRENFHRAHES